MKSGIIKISKQEADYYQGLLDSDPDENRGSDILKTWSIPLGEGYEVDIKVCDGDIPYVDAVLFKNGTEVDVDGPGETLIGENSFSDGDKEFIVSVEIDNETV